MTRLHKPAFFLVCGFVATLGTATFIFSYQLTNYIVHVLPFFLIIAAYGCVQLYKIGVDVLTERLGTLHARRPLISGLTVRIFVFIVLLGWLPMTIWFKLGARAPRYRHGQYNLVHTFAPWERVAAIVIAEKEPGDVVISSIPLTLRYYGLESDYNLNIGYNDIAENRDVKDEEGRLLDPYSGVVTVMDLPFLEAIVRKHPKGWLVSSAYVMELESCVLPEVKAYIDANFQLYRSDTGLRIYRWETE
jgi:hypothetical protein